MRRVGVAVAVGCVLTSLVGGSAATATVAAVPSTPWAWGGLNNHGQLGNGTTTASSPTPQKVCDTAPAICPGSGLSGMTAIAGGDSHSLAVKSDGRVLAWGWNSAGQLGNGTTADGLTPVKVCDTAPASCPGSALSGVTAVAGGYEHSLALKSDGTVWAWGDYEWGQLGSGATADSSTPVPVCDTAPAICPGSRLIGVTAIAAGQNHSLALKDGTVWTWGYNGNGELGNGTTGVGVPTPSQVCDAAPASCPGSVLSQVIAIAGGSDYNLALKSDGTVWAWGGNTSGQLGNGSTTDSPVPVKVCDIAPGTCSGSGLIGVTAIAAGPSSSHSLALRADGTIRAWGGNAKGQLGDGTITDSPIPVKVCDTAPASCPGSLLSGVTAIAGSSQHSLALKSEGTVSAWGDNVFGELGDGTTNSSATPVQVSLLSGVTAIAAGGGHSLANVVGLLRVTSNPALSTQISVDGQIADSWGLNWLKAGLGTHTICFAHVEGWTEPPCQTVTVNSNVTTKVTGTFTQRGTLRVLTSPAVHSQITVDGIPRDDYGMFTDIPTGTHSVCFGLVPNFTLTPAGCQSAVVTAGMQTTITGTFTSTPGSPGQTGVGWLRVVSSPALPTQISVDGKIADSWGLTWLELPSGPHTVCFTHVEGYTEPACSTPNVPTGGATVKVTATFTQRGFLRVQTSPAVAATMLVDGIPRNDWGMWTDIPTGAHTVCFGSAPGYAKTPQCVPATVNPGATTTVTGTYG